MKLKSFKNAFLFVVSLLFFALPIIAQDSTKEAHTRVALRMMGHQLLLRSGDSTSRVFAIEKGNDKYKLQFSSDFAFDPADLVAVTDSVVKEAGIATDYLIEVEGCENKEVVYSFEVSSTENKSIIPCSGRALPKSCYLVYLSIFKNDQPSEASEANISIAFLMLFLVLIAAAGFFYKKRQTKAELQTDLIAIGAYTFDKRNMRLSFEDKEIELTGKEVDLLALLYTSANTTLEREHILNVVWGDEGDYVGRTLDVFISKLRKKLEGDPAIKIANIRGIGYKFILNA